MHVPYCPIPGNDEFPGPPEAMAVPRVAHLLLHADVARVLHEAAAPPADIARRNLQGVKSDRDQKRPLEVAG